MSDTLNTDSVEVALVYVANQMVQRHLKMGVSLEEERGQFEETLRALLKTYREGEPKRAATVAL